VANTDRRIRRTCKSLHEALISLLLEKNYDEITVQEILDRADVGRSTFYAHFEGKDELLVSGIHDLRITLDSAVQRGKSSAKRYENVLAFSRAMFDHANGYRNVYHAILHTQVWPRVSRRLQELLKELIERECKAEIARLKKARSDIPVDLFVHYLTTTFFTVMTWWMDRRSRLAPAQIDEMFRSLVLPTVRAVLA